jgi:hypothetical protein
MKFTTILAGAACAVLFTIGDVMASPISIQSRAAASSKVIVG